MRLDFYIYLVVAIAYIAYDHIKDLPFNYITQTNYAVCEKMNNTFCIRIGALHHKMLDSAAICSSVSDVGNTTENRILSAPPSL